MLKITRIKAHMWVRTCQNAFNNAYKYVVYRWRRSYIMVLNENYNNICRIGRIIIKKRRKKRKRMNNKNSKITKWRKNIFCSLFCTHIRKEQKTVTLHKDLSLFIFLSYLTYTSYNMWTQKIKSITETPF